jgi:hypothetical protein
MFSPQSLDEKYLPLLRCLVSVNFRSFPKEICLPMSEREVLARHELRLADAALMLPRLDANTLKT